MASAPRTTVRLLYDGADISADISPALLQFDFTDNAKDSSDEITVTLEDRAGLWRGDWLPTKGALLSAFIVPAFSSVELYCGQFEIDDIGLGGPPRTVTIKAVSTGISSSLRREKKNRAWQGATLADIAAEVAAAASLQPFYDAETVTYQRIDQREESDLAFVRRLATDAGYAVKVSDRRLVVFDEARYEQRGPVALIDCEAGSVTKYDLRTKSSEVYKAAVSRYRDPATNEYREYRYEPAGAPAVGQVLQLHQRVDSIGDARALCERQLRMKNSREVQASFTAPGDPVLQAGQVVTLIGLASFSGEYLMDVCRHTVSRSGGYTVSVDCHRSTSYASN